MPNTFNNTTFSTTYYDDFRDSDNYHKLLFNDGRTLQARELTQSQTLINKDIRRFADNIYKEGAVIKPGGITVNDEYEFVKLNTSSGATPTASYLGATLTGATSGIVAKVIEVVASTSSDPSTLYVEYTDLNGGTQLRFTPGETLTISGLDDVVVQTTDTTADPAVGPGTQANIGDSIYYVKGHFVFCPRQSFVVDKYNNNADDGLVLKVIEDVITTADDTGLFDNSGGTPNLSAPGADRYRIRLVLDVLSNMDSDTNFIQIANIFDGSVTNIIDENDAYNIPDEMVSQRIKENSGDYLIKPYSLKFELDSASTSTQLDAVLGEGIAVIQGHRVTNQFNQTFTIPRAQDTETETNEQIATSFGNFVKVTTGQGSDSGDILGLPNINVLQQFNLYTGASLGGAQAGKARIRAVTEDGAVGFKFHLVDIDLDPGVNFRNIKSIGDSANGKHFDIVQEDSKSVIHEPDKNDLLFPTPYIRPNNFADISLTTQQFFTGTTNGSGALTITVTDTSNEVFDNTADLLVVRTAGGPDTSFTISSGGTGSTTIAFAGLDNSTSYDILAYVKKATNVASRTKTLTTSTVTGVSSSTDSDGNTVFSLGQPDIYKLDSVRIASSAGNDVKGRFELDNGQRDNFYDIGRLVLKGGQTAPSTIYAKFRHFEHGATGEFFSAKSYTGQIDYQDVYSYRKNDATVINLNDVLDFRAVKNTSGTFSGGDARVHFLPQPTDTVEADVTYYLPRRDVITANKDGEFSYIQGLSSFEPLFPQIQPESMLLYNIELNPFTLHDSDMSVIREEHRRYTMRDIEQIDRRVDNLEETTALTLLETDLSNINVLDSTGVVRAKSGFFVDNFETQRFSDVENTGYRASIDPLNSTLRPGFYSNNIRLTYDSDNSSNTIRVGNTVMLKHTEQPFLKNEEATGTINVNPFGILVSDGMLTLSPASADWYDTETKQVVTDGGTIVKKVRMNARFDFDRFRSPGQYFDWAYNWGGKTFTVNNSTNLRQLKRQGLKTGDFFLKGKTITETRKETVNERELNHEYTPFIKSQLVYFKAEGLRPNTRVFAYFDDRDVSSWVRQQSSFVEHGSTTTDYGNQYNTASEYPFSGGPSTLTTDATGKIIGSFFIPNTDTIRFETGVKEFKLLDIPVNSGQEFVFGFGNSLSRASAKFTATGIIPKEQENTVVYKTVYVAVSSQSNKSRGREARYYVDTKGNIRRTYSRYKTSGRSVFAASGRTFGSRAQIKNSSEFKNANIKNTSGR
jgi:hypothetical protein|tara:strand:- start:685 stop:4437 length:3753 start_codon:yes stop_codon:yes gene_type:complete